MSVKNTKFGKTTTSLPKGIQNSLGSISKSIAKFNAAVKRMEKDSKYNRQQITSFKSQFYATNAELFDILTEDRLKPSPSSGKKAIRNAIAEYYENSGIPYNEETMLAEKAAEIEANIDKIENAGYLKPKEFIEQHWKQVNLVDKAIIPNLTMEEAVAVKPELKEQIAEKFFELKEHSKYRYLKSDEILMEAYAEIMEGADFSEELKDYLDDADMVKEFGNTLGFDFGDDGWL